MAAYHLFLTIYSHGWTIYIHIILNRKHPRIYSSQKKIGNCTKIPAYIGVKIWESLEVQPFYVFKKKCKLHFLNQY